MSMTPDAEDRQATPERASWQVWRWPLHWQIFLAIACGAALGVMMGVAAVAEIPAEIDSRARGAAGTRIVRDTHLFALVELAGDLFLRALFLLIVPLVTSSIVLAVHRIARERDFARLGLKTLAYYLATSVVAIGTGVLLVNLVAPGISNGAPLLQGHDLSAFGGAQAEVARRTEGRGLADFLNVFRAMVPGNLFSAAVESNLLGLIFVSLAGGFFATRLGDRQRDAFGALVESIHDLSLMGTRAVLRLAPLGVLFLIARTFAEQYAALRPDGRFADLLTGVASFAAVALAALLVHLLVTMPLVLLLVARVNPLRHYRAMAPALMTAFSTASSAATLPLTLECVQKRAGVSERIGGFAIPIGATVNMDGTALYECVAAIFICQAFGVELTLAQQALIVLIALVTSVGVAGVPSASLVAIAVILQTVQGQLPPTSQVNLLLGMGLLFVFDRPLDMLRTAVNVFSDSVGAVAIARSEGEAVLSDEGR
jgi:proton glutamate symport protein